MRDIYREWNENRDGRKNDYHLFNSRTGSRYELTHRVSQNDYDFLKIVRGRSAGIKGLNIIFVLFSRTDVSISLIFEVMYGIIPHGEEGQIVLEYEHYYR